MLQVTIQGVERRRTAPATVQVCTTLSAIFFLFLHSFSLRLFLPYFLFLHSFSLHLFVSQKSLNDEERGGNCLLVPERSYGSEFQNVQVNKHHLGLYKEIKIMVQAKLLN